jgi:hypothetical protein
MWVKGSFARGNHSREFQDLLQIGVFVRIHDL